ncbi:hypothetical protein [Thalassotalea sp. G2M2-11]|uniref:hypothetical protein n=1 Tax=Thalassotalea sp. G2M2-11 TaxID=2787627 RepID=UPI0019D10AE3|nr:hypothetical protein [Thalassotalea sp. G2M2-11]
MDKQTPLRTVIVPSAKLMAKQFGGLNSSFKVINDSLTSDSESAQVVHGKRIKLFADGAMFSQLMQLAALSALGLLLVMFFNSHCIP